MLSKELKKLKMKSKKIFEKNKNIIFDIVLFGSVIKGKFKPNDIDICVIFSRKISHDEISKILSEFNNVHAEHLFLTELYKEPLWLELFHEGYSLTRGKFLYKLFKMKPWFLFNYNLKKLKPVEKSKFSHALFGRKGDGILSMIGGKVFGRGSILVPVDNSEKIREVLERWGIDYEAKKIFIY